MNSESVKKLGGFLNQPTELEQNLREYIKTHRMSPIAQYAEVLEYILLRSNHPTIDDIYSELSQEDQTLTRSRLYSILDIFTKAEVIDAVCIDQDTIYYEAKAALPHGHFICTSCGGMKDVPFAVEHVKMVNVGAIESMSVVYKGFCKLCVGTQIN